MKNRVNLPIKSISKKSPTPSVNFLGIFFVIVGL